MDVQHIIDTASTQLTTFGLKAVGAVAVWIVGRWLIGFGVRLISAALTRQQVDPTLLRYIGNIVSVALNIVLVVAILGYFGVETTSFAALVAGMGIAIGAAWAGLLANFAAGAFLVVLRPFKVGDYVVAGGVEGTVKEVGLFASTIVTPDNVVTMVGNNKIFSDNITNYNTNGARRVELQMQVAGSVDLNALMAKVAARVATIPNVLKTPAVEVNIATFNLAGPVLNVRPYCNNDHYWQVLADTNAAINECGAGLPPPAPHQVMIQKHG